MDSLILVEYLAVGVLSGILAGLFGIGGGLVIVPILIFSFSVLGISDSVAMHLAVGTSLACIMLTSISSTKAHHDKGGIDWSIVALMTLGIVAGCFVGAFVANLLSGEILKNIVGAFSICMSMQLALNLKPKSAEKVLSRSKLISAGGLIGGLSAILGIGGGSLTVPFLAWHSVPMQRAVAVSAACGFPIALSGTLSYIWFGWSAQELPAWSLGYVYLPALLGVCTTSVIFSRLGAKLAYYFSAIVLRWLFASLLFIVGCSFFVLN